MRVGSFVFISLLMTTSVRISSCSLVRRPATTYETKWTYPQRLQSALDKPFAERREPLEALLRDDESNVRIVAAEALAGVKSEASVEPLIRSLGDFNPFVRSAAESALAGIGVPAVQRLLERVRSARRPAEAMALLAIVGRSDSGKLSDKLREDVLEATRSIRCLNSMCLRQAVAPEFPRLARQARITGFVRVEFQLNDAGLPIQVKATDGHPLLAQAAIDAVQKSVFDGPSRVGTSFVITVDFKTRGEWYEPGGSAFETLTPDYWTLVIRFPEVMID